MKAKRKILILILTFFALTFACLGVGCNEMLKETCQHDKDAKELIALQDAQCGEECEVTWVCKVCEEQITMKIATGWHAFDEGTVTLAPTCTEEGVLTYSCIECGAITNTNIPGLGHAPVVDSEVVSTCTATGLTEGSHCSRCDVILTPQTTISKLKHDFDHGDNCADCGTERCLTNLTFIADGVTIEEIEYDVNSTGVELPIIPEKNGYTSTWESYSLNYENATVNAIYTPIVYKIQYVRAGLSSTSKSYYIFGENSEYRKSGQTGGNYPTEYTIESGALTISNLRTGFTCACGGGATYKFKGWYLDEERTQAFNGTIPAGSTGDIILYADISLTGTHFY